MVGECSAAQKTRASVRSSRTSAAEHLFGKVACSSFVGRLHDFRERLVGGANNLAILLHVLARVAILSSNDLDREQAKALCWQPAL